jgi:hypothetical protein
MHARERANYSGRPDPKRVHRVANGRREAAAGRTFSSIDRVPIKTNIICMIFFTMISLTRFVRSLSLALQKISALCLIITGWLACMQVHLVILRLIVPAGLKLDQSHERNYRASCLNGSTQLTTYVRPGNKTVYSKLCLRDRLAVILGS